MSVSSDGGQTWTLATDPAGLGVLQSAACLNATDCVAAGTTTTTVSDVVPAKGELLRSADGGHSWVPSGFRPAGGRRLQRRLPIGPDMHHRGDEVGRPARHRHRSSGQSLNGGLTFSASSSAYVPIALTALVVPRPGVVRRRRGRHGGPDHPDRAEGNPPCPFPHARPGPGVARGDPNGHQGVTETSAGRQKQGSLVKGGAPP